MCPNAWRVFAIVLGVVLLTACAPRAVERPREGAQPIGGSTPVRLMNSLPPTLSPAGRLAQTPTATPETAPPAPPSPSPERVRAASPAIPSGLAPIIAGLQPAPGAAISAGDVTIGARVTGSSDLVEVQAFIDGELIPVDVGGEGVRVKTVSFVRSFVSGTHEVRIQARDEAGQLGGYRWQFSVGAARPPAAASTARPAAPAAPTRTPMVVPTRRPTAAPKPTGGPGR
jgi:hypothetical protein